MAMAAAASIAALMAATAGAQTTGPDGDLRSQPPQSAAWWDVWFAPAGPKPAAVKPVADGEKAVISAPTGVEASAAVRRREQAAYLRRQAVCDRLRQVAVQSGDDALYQQAQDLEDRAWALYQDRTAGLPGGSSLVEGDAAPRPKGGRGDSRAELMRGAKP
jgi:hypothetical protein